MYLVNGIDVQPFLDARGTFELFRKGMVTDRDKAGAIQAFEFTYELAWKTIKRLLEREGVLVRSPREAFREAAALKMISEPEAWFRFIDARNETVHTYVQEARDRVLETFDEFSRHLNEIVNFIEHERKRAVSKG
jgi:nucleotidyltransferase substrate binding protein (TIGR01987 family)